MISRIEGILEAVEGQVVRLRLPAGPGVGGICIDALVPAYLADRLAAEEGAPPAAPGRPIRLETLLTLESVGQGTSFSPRLIGFEGAASRRFFEIFTTVKGLGSRRALRAMAVEPGVIASAIVAGDHKALEKLPEIGKRLAQTICAELSGKVDSFAIEAHMVGIESKGPARPGGRMPPVAQDAIDALLALGETAADAERRIRTALADAAGPPDSADELVAMALRGR